MRLLYGGRPLEGFDDLLSSQRLLRQSFPGLVQRLRGLDAVGPSHRGPNLDLFLRLTLAPEDDPEELLREIRSLPMVEKAVRVVPRAADPPSTDYEAAGYQGYLRPGASHGIDAYYAWSVPYAGSVPIPFPVADGRGRGVTVCVCDKAYCDTHDNLPVISAEYGTQSVGVDADAQHGTQVLGVLGAPHTANVGTVGICPLATFHFSGTESNRSADVKEAVDDALDVTKGNLEAGDVLILEAQLSLGVEGLPAPVMGMDLVPVEVNEDVRVALRDAAETLGVTVVEAAGNSGFELVEILDASGTSLWDPDDVSDSSRAILVGA